MSNQIVKKYKIVKPKSRASRMEQIPMAIVGNPLFASYNQVMREVKEPHTLKTCVQASINLCPFCVDEDFEDYDCGNYIPPPNMCEEHHAEWAEEVEDSKFQEESIRKQEVEYQVARLRKEIEANKVQILSLTDKQAKKKLQSKNDSLISHTHMIEIGVKDMGVRTMWGMSMRCYDAREMFGDA